MKRTFVTATLFTAALAMGGSVVAAPKDAPKNTNEKMFTDEADGTNWPSYGRTYSENFYSPLSEINAKNINRLKLASYIDLPVMISAVSTPLAVDGTLYFAVGLSLVYAADPITGKILWSYDPKVAEANNDKLKVAWGIRGLAYSDGRIFVGTQDGRLIALSAKTGKLVWSVDTTEPGDGRYITGAPRVFNGKVIIGHGGADFFPTRGYVTAYDMASGKQAWRFYTVPGDPKKGFENKAMEMAAKTWKGEWWKHGGGGTAWNAIAYDPKYNRILIGTGNGSPWNQEIRSPGGGDNLFTCSIVAVDADTGAYAWHYQTTPGETWDYNSDMDIALSTLAIDGKPRDVAMHAPKNGFFYVIDRADGKLISAEPFSKVTWAKYVDKTTGRPVENPEARPKNGGQAYIFPGAGGAHGWYPMSFSQQTKLMYIPAFVVGGYYDSKGIDPKTWKPTPRPAFNHGFQTTSPIDDRPAPDREMHSELQARDPVTQKVVWSVPGRAVNDGGVMSTGGNLVFQGKADGTFVAYAADTGKKLWSTEAQNGINAEPITYTVRGKQYVTVIAGFAGPPTLSDALAPAYGWTYRGQQRRVLTYTLDGRAQLPKQEKPQPEEVVDDETMNVDASKVAQGRDAYDLHCMLCHGPSAVSGGGAPDLRASSIPLSDEAFRDVLTGGALQPAGMPKFDELTPAQVEGLRHYVRHQARKAMEKLRQTPVR